MCLLRPPGLQPDQPAHASKWLSGCKLTAQDLLLLARPVDGRLVRNVQLKGAVNQLAHRTGSCLSPAFPLPSPSLPVPRPSTRLSPAFCVSPASDAP